MWTQTYHGLDVFFNSTIQPKNPSTPIAMGFGFFQSQGGNNQGQQQWNEKISQNSQFYFSIFETAYPPADIDQIVISLTNRDGSPGTPFDWSLKALNRTDPEFPQKVTADYVWSAGCNLGQNQNLTIWELGPY